MVTANYPARARGVQKLMLITEAKKLCPELVCVVGEDLTPYRQTSKRMLSVLSRFGPAEKLGFDEVSIDVTAEAQRRVLLQPATRGPAPPPFVGFVHVPEEAGVAAPNRYRPMDLQAVPGAAPLGQGARCGWRRPIAMFVACHRLAPDETLMPRRRPLRQRG